MTKGRTSSGSFVLPNHPPQPLHHGLALHSMLAQSSRRSLLLADDDGWRTPTIEDSNHPQNLQLQGTPTANGHSSSYFDGLHQRRLESIRTAPLQHAGPQGGRPSTSSAMDDSPPTKLPLKARIKHVTWAWFTVTMATGGIASVLHAVPFRFDGLRTIGLIFFFTNIVFYLFIWGLVLIRFWFFPYMFKASFTHPTESLFVPAFAVSFGTILINIVEYGFGQVGPWLNRCVLVLYWLDAALAIVLSVTIYLILWSTQSFTIARMTPIWIFPAYPMLIIGPHAANLAAKLAYAPDSIQVIIGGFTIQGIGFLVSLTIYAAFVYRLMTQKLPEEPLRPGMFVSVGPSAFTVTGVIGMANQLGKTFDWLPGRQYMDVPGPLAASILRLVANWGMLWLWGLALWFFFVSLLANIVCFRKKSQMPFAMTWFSFIFPQTALTTATFNIAQAFNVHALRIVGCVMTCCVIVVWILVISMMIRAIITKQILWPEKGEDKTEGGFQMPIDSLETIAEDPERQDVRQDGHPKPSNP